MRAHVGEARALEQVPHCRALQVAVLDDQPAVTEKVARRLRHDCLQRLEARRPREQRRGGLVATHAGFNPWIVAGDVRRVAHDEVEALAGHRLVPANLQHIDALRSANRIRIGYLDALVEYYTALAEYEAATGRRIIE